MGFFETLDAVCDAQNAHLDEVQAQREAQAVAEREKQEAEEKVRRRNWAVGVLAAGSMPLEKRKEICAAMKIAVTDSEVSCAEVERLLLKHEIYRPIIYRSVLEKFLERGGDPAGELGAYCVQQALSLSPEADPFAGDVAEKLDMGLIVLGRFNTTKRPEIAKAYKILRKLFPFTKKGNLRGMPDWLGAKLYPENYDAEGHCTYRFASRTETSASRKIANNQPRRRDEDAGDEETKLGMEMAENGQIPGIRLVRAVS